MPSVQAAAVVGADNASLATMDAYAVLDLLALQPQQAGAAASGAATGAPVVTFPRVLLFPLQRIGRKERQNRACY